MQERQPFSARLFDADGTPRERAMWLVFAGIVASQLLAFFVVCQHQVERAEARHAQVQGATADCTGPAVRAALRCRSQTADAASVPMGSQLR